MYCSKNRGDFPKGVTSWISYSYSSTDSFEFYYDAVEIRRCCSKWSYCCEVSLFWEMNCSLLSRTHGSVFHIMRCFASSLPEHILVSMPALSPVWVVFVFLIRRPWLREEFLLGTWKRETLSSLETFLLRFVLHLRNLIVRFLPTRVLLISPLKRRFT